MVNSAWWRSMPWLSLERDKFKPVGPFLCFGSFPNQKNILDCISHRKTLFNQDEAGALLRRNEVGEVDWHCAAFYGLP
jgi:hypothetical protein